MDFILYFLDYIHLKIEDNYYLSLIIFLSIMILYNSLSLPGNPIVMISAGFFYGTIIGFSLSIIGIVLGSLIFYQFVSFLFKKFFPVFYNKYSFKAHSYLSDSTFEYLVIFRMIPGFPLIVQNLVLTILKIDKFKFIISSIIGFSPLVFAFVYFGNQLNNISKLQSFTISEIFSLEILILIFLLILLITIRIIYAKKRPSK
ncbi:VTT domain-containing protein [Alphaproteobacteria bacterium]|nr:VTT domain-containing protein [Alphaproteobacteria bacterium]